MASTLTFKQLHPTFGVEISGADFSSSTDQLLLEQFKRAVAKYGVCIFRATEIDDERQIELAKRLGEVEQLDGTPTDRCRLKDIELEDNILFQADGSYNVRRTRFSMLRACEVPLAVRNTEFIDTRTAFEELPKDWQDELLARDYVANHSFWHSRKTASPKIFARLDSNRHPSSKHRLVQWHLPSDRLNLYIPSYVRDIDGLSEEESRQKLGFLQKHVMQEKYILNIPWLNVGDLMIWDNTCTLHRTEVLEKQGRRNVQRCGSLDGGVDAYGMNPKDDGLNFAFSEEVVEDVLRCKTS